MFLPHVHIPYEKIREHINLIKQNSLNLEIYFSSEVMDTLSDGDIISTMKLLDHKPSLSFHAPFMDLSPGAVDNEIRRVTISRITRILDIADIMKPLAIVCHSGYEKWRYALKTDIWLEKSLLTWQPLNRLAADMGVNIAIENIFEDEPSNLKMLMESMDSDNFGICFDTGHFNLFAKDPIDDWMNSISSYIKELHLHDNDRTSDQHLPVSDGTFDFNNFFDLLKNKDCIYTIEAHTPQKVLRSIENLSKLIAEGRDEYNRTL